MTPGIKKLREVSFVVMGTSPKGHTYNSAGEGLPLLNGPTEFGDRHPSCTLFTTNSVKECEPGDLIFCVRGSTTGRMNWADRKYSLGRGVCAIRGASELDTRFIKYCLDHRLDALLQLAGGTTFPNLTQDAIKDFEIPFPQSRTRIAEILSAYDDLIENNRRRMALLEESARLLYQEWFVRLRFPGHEHVRIVKGLPESWTRKSLGEVAQFRLGKMLDQNKNKGDLMPYLANINVRWGEFDLSDLREMRFEHDELEAFGLKYGDIVMCEGGEPGRCAIWKEQMPGMMIQKAIHRIRARDNMHHVYLYYSLRHQGQAGHLATLFTGATIKHLPREKLEKVTIVVPPAGLLDLFVQQADPIERQRKLLESMNWRAAEARDLLLPRLMSQDVTA